MIGRIKLAVGIAAVGLLAFFGASIWRANSGVPSFPSLPELASVKLSLPAAARTSRALATFFRPQTKAQQSVRPTGGPWPAWLGPTVTLTVPRSYEAAQQLGAHETSAQDGRWLRDPERVLTSLRRLEPPLASFRKALQAPGCLPLAKFERPNELVSYPYFVAAVRLDLVESVALIQRGEHQRGARQIQALADRLVELEQRCRLDLTTLLILDHTLLRVQRAWSYLLANPEAKAEHAAIWQRMLQLERRPLRVADAWRQEAVSAAQRLRRTGERVNGISFDREATLSVFDLLMKRRVWLAQAGLHDAAWTQTFAEDAYLDRLTALHGWPWLRRNGEGLRVLAAMGRRGDYKYVMKVHVDRCGLAAQRALWMQQLARRGQLSEPAQLRPVVDPFSKRPFGALSPRRPVCKPPARYRFEESVTLVSLPGWPITKDNSGPAPRR